MGLSIFSSMVLHIASTGIRSNYRSPSHAFNPAKQNFDCPDQAKTRFIDIVARKIVGINISEEVVNDGLLISSLKRCK